MTMPQMAWRGKRAIPGCAALHAKSGIRPESSATLVAEDASLVLHCPFRDRDVTFSENKIPLISKMRMR